MARMVVQEVHVEMCQYSTVDFLYYWRFNKIIITVDFLTGHVIFFLNVSGHYYLSY